MAWRKGCGEGSVEAGPTWSILEAQGVVVDGDGGGRKGRESAEPSCVDLRKVTVGRQQLY